MTTISHREMRNSSAEVLRRVAAGESFTITNHGEPVAEIGPVQRTILAGLEAKGELRRATAEPAGLLQIQRVRSDLTTAEIIADIRGDR